MSRTTSTRTVDLGHGITLASRGTRINRTSAHSLKDARRQGKRLYREWKKEGARPVRIMAADGSRTETVAGIRADWEQSLMDPTDKHPVLPASLVAREKGVFLETLYRAIRSGALNGYKAGATWLVMNDAKLDQWKPPLAGRPPEKKRRRARPTTLPRR